MTTPAARVGERSKLRPIELRRWLGAAWPARARVRDALLARSHWIPVVGSAIANLWLLARETVPVENFSDSANHLPMVAWVTQQLREGHLPFDGWYPYLGLGSSNFHRYQSLPHILTGLAGVFVGPSTAFFWSLYLLLALWPISVYWGARLLGWDGWSAAAAAAVSPVLVSVTCYGFENCTYVWWGLGAWTQLWGMWMLPLTLGLTWRAVTGRGSLALGALSLALCIAFHFLTGYLAVLMVGVWVIIGGRELLARIPRAIAVGLGTLLIASWVLVPLATDSYLFAGAGTGFIQGSFWLDSYGAPKVLGWLTSGQLFDFGRTPPVVTVLVAGGVVVAVGRAVRDERSRGLLALFGVSLVLFIGRASLPGLIGLLPFNHSLFLHRYVFGVQMGGILLAGAFLAWSARRVIQALTKGVPWLAARSPRQIAWPHALTRLGWTRPAMALAAAAIAVTAVLLANTAWTNRVEVEQGANAARDYQQQREAAVGPLVYALIDTATGFHDGRVFGGTAAGGQGQSWEIGYAQLFAVLPQHGADTIGFTLRVQSMMGDPEAFFDYTNPAQDDLFNVRYFLLPDTTPPPFAVTKLADQGGFSLYRVPTSGYVEVVDTVWPPLVVTTPDTFDTQTAAFMGSAQLKALQFPPVAIGGRAAADPTVVPGGIVSGPAGSVVTQSATIQDGLFQATVQANRPAEVLLKESFDPRWTATVDGRAVQPQLLAPALVGVPVPAGQHTVVFRYDPISYYPWLFLLAILTIAALHFGPRLATRLGLRLGSGRLGSGRIAIGPRVSQLAGGALTRAPARLPRLGRRPLKLVAWRIATQTPTLTLERWAQVGIALALAVAAAVLQVAGRGPLGWDESERVEAGWHLTYALQTADLGAAWQWINDQTFYLFLMPAVHGVLMFLGAGPLVAAWLPSLVAFAAALLLVPLLAAEMGAGRVGRWLALILVALIPLEWPLSAVALTELPGLALYLGLLLALARLERSPRPSTAVAAGVLAALLAYMKWDYAAIAGATLGLSALLAIVTRRDWATLKWHALALVVAGVLVGGFLSVNFSAKMAGLASFTPSPGGPPDLTYLLGELAGQIGIAAPLLVLLGGSFVLGAALGFRRPAIRPALIFVGVSYAVYTVEYNGVHPRYVASLVALVCVLGAVGLDWAIHRWQAPAQARVPRPALVVAAVMVAVAVSVPQVPQLGIRNESNQPDDPAAAIAGFAVEHMSPAGPVVYIGASNEVSTYALQLDWESTSGSPSPAVAYVPWSPPDQRAAYLVSFIEGRQPASIIAVGVTPGSRLDTEDYRTVWAGQYDYFTAARALGAKGCLDEDGETSTDGGRIQVIAWSVRPGVNLPTCASSA